MRSMQSWRTSLRRNKGRKTRRCLPLLLADRSSVYITTFRPKFIRLGSPVLSIIYPRNLHTTYPKPRCFNLKTNLYNPPNTRLGVPRVKAPLGTQE